MQLSNERIELLRATMIGEGSNYMFKTQDGNEYGIWEKHTNFFPKDTEECKTVDDKTLYGKELTALIFLGWEGNQEINKEIGDWEDFARQVGVSKLEATSTKIPTVIKARFEFFANERSTPSAVLRNLIYEYVKKQMVDNIDSLVFKEKI